MEALKCLFGLWLPFIDIDSIRTRDDEGGPGLKPKIGLLDQCNRVTKNYRAQKKIYIFSFF